MKETRFKISAYGVIRREGRIHRWLPEQDVVDLDRAIVVDTALDLERRRPEDGRAARVAVTGRLRH